MGNNGPSQGSLGISSMFAFIVILTIGFIVEWVEGALEW